jgi:hypothetical protein
MLLHVACQNIYFPQAPIDLKTANLLPGTKNTLRKIMNNKTSQNCLFFNLDKIERIACQLGFV